MSKSQHDAHVRLTVTYSKHEYSHALATQDWLEAIIHAVRWYECVRLVIMYSRRDWLENQMLETAVLNPLKRPPSLFPI